MLTGLRLDNAILPGLQKTSFVVPRIVRFCFWWDWFRLDSYVLILCLFGAAKPKSIFALTCFWRTRWRYCEISHIVCSSVVSTDDWSPTGKCKEASPAFVSPVVLNVSCIPRIYLRSEFCTGGGRAGESGCNSSGLDIVPSLMCSSTDLRLLPRQGSLSLLCARILVSTESSVCLGTVWGYSLTFEVDLSIMSPD